MSDQTCLWCDFTIKSPVPFCPNCGMMGQQAVRVRPYVSEGIDPNDVVIDPMSGLLLQRDNYAIDIYNLELYHLNIRVNRESLAKLAANSGGIYLDFLGVARKGLVLASNNFWHTSWCLGYDFFHQELFGRLPNMAAKAKEHIIRNQEYHWFAVVYIPTALR